jgi:hypothetical protein
MGALLGGTAAGGRSLPLADHDCYHVAVVSRSQMLSVRGKGQLGIAGEAKGAGAQSKERRLVPGLRPSGAHMPGCANRTK